MNLSKNGSLIRSLRKASGMTQKQLAEKIGVVPKTVSKWETGHGFPDVGTVLSLAAALGVKEKTLLSGTLLQNAAEGGNVKKTKFCVCPQCGAISVNMGNVLCECCGKSLKPLKAASRAPHKISISEIENDFYAEIDCEMTKEHYIDFAAYIATDRVLLMRLYPESDCAVRFPKMYGGRLVCHCNVCGLFEYREG